MRRAIRLGDGWYPASSNPANRLDTAARVADAMAAFKVACEKAGRDPSLFKIAPAVKVIVAETAAQAEHARRLGARFAQGYHFSRPLPVDEWLALLHDAPGGALQLPLAPAAARVASQLGGGPRKALYAAALALSPAADPGA